jgi:hypothetical protein
MHSTQSPAHVPNSRGVRHALLVVTGVLLTACVWSGCSGGGGGGITLTGTATDAESPYAAVPNAYVYVPAGGVAALSSAGARQAEPLAEATTDAGGHYTLTGLTAGPHMLLIEPVAGSGYAECEREVVLGSAPTQTINTSVLRADLAAMAVAMVVAPSRASVAPGGTALFGFGLRDDQGTLIDRHPLGNWAVEGGVGVVTANGHFQAGTALGTGTVVCCVGGLRGTSQVAVTDNPAAGAIHVSPESLDFAAGETQKTLTIEDTTGTGVLWMCGESIPWMNLSMPSGSGSATMTVTVDRELFPSGTGHGQIVFTWTGGSENVSVTLRN